MRYMSYFESIILGIIEGVTEFLPISSTAHLILGASALGIVQSDFVKSFEIIIQLGAILAVVVFFWKKLFDLNTIKLMLIGFIPTAVLGLLFYKRIKSYLGDVSVVLWALFIGGVILIVFEWWYAKRVISTKRSDKLTPRQAFLVGCFQSIAFVPGVSRSGATIVGGMTLGISRTAIAEYSFLLAVPTMCAATGLDVIKNHKLIFSSGNLGVLITGFATSFIGALIAIKFFLGYVKKNNFVYFGVYRIAIAIIFFLTLRGL